MKVEWTLDQLSKPQLEILISHAEDVIAKLEDAGKLSDAQDIRRLVHAANLMSAVVFPK